MRLNKFAAWAALLLCAGATASAEQFVIIDPLPGDDWVLLRGVSAGGSVATGSSYAGSWSNGRAFIWTADTGTVELPNLGYNSWALDISADGTTIVGGLSDADWTGVRWVDGELEILAVTPEIPWVGTIAVSGDGNVITGEGMVDGEFVAIRWTPDEVIALDVAPSWYSFGTAISADGNVIAGLSEYDAAEAFLWTEADGVQWLGYLPNGEEHSTIVTLSEDGSVGGGQSDRGTVGTEGYFAVYWTQDTGWVEIPSIIPSARVANAVTGVGKDGSLMVGRNTGTNPPALDLFIWDEVNGPRSLQPVLEQEYGIDFGDWQLNEKHHIEMAPCGRVIFGSTLKPGTDTKRGWIVYLDPQEIPGDINGDGCVDQADLALLLSAYGTVPGDPNWNPDADITGDDEVGHADLAVLLANYGEGC